MTKPHDTHWAAGLSPDEAASRWVAALSRDDVQTETWMEFQAWITAAPEHREAYGAALALWKSPGLRAAVAKPKLARLSVAGIALAAVLAIGITTTWVTLSGPQRERFENASRTVNRIALPDGSRVHLAADTTIVWRADRQIRTVTFEGTGQAFFDVSRSGQPFSVDARSVTVSVIGTAFDVNVLSDSIVVSLSRGSIDLTWPQGSRRLRPGDALQVFDDGRVSPKKTLTTSPSWIGGRLSIRDENAESVVEQLSRYSDRPITLDPGVQPASDLNGSFSLADIPGSLSLVSDALGARLINKPGGYFLCADHSQVPECNSEPE